MHRSYIFTLLVQRSSERGFFTGVAVGAGYGVALPFVISLLSVFTPGLGQGDLDFGVAVILLGVPIGLVVGGIVGMLAGATLGLVNGVAVGLLTTALYTPMHDADEYRWSVPLLCVFTTLAVIFAPTALLGRILTEGRGLVYGGIPLLLTLPCAWVSGARLAQWYLAQADELGTRYNRDAGMPHAPTEDTGEV